MQSDFDQRLMQQNVEYSDNDGLSLHLQSAQQYNHNQMIIFEAINMLKP